MKKRFSIFILLFIIALSLRVYPLKTSAPFWVDEFNSGVQAANLLAPLSLKSLSFPIRIERNNYLSHLLISISFYFFGVSENSARMPFIVAGSVVPLAIYFLCRKRINERVAIVAAMFLTFSYFEIAWSNQARGYVLQQLISAILFIVYLQFIEKDKKPTLKQFLFIVALSMLGILTHNMFVLPIFAMIAHFMIFRYRVFFQVVRKPFSAFVFVFLLATFIYSSSIYKVFSNDLFSMFNNAWYYHALLWREYGLMVFLAVIGFIWGLKKNLSLTFLASFLIISQLIFVTFFFGHYMSKYILPVFHYIFLFAGAGIVLIGDSLSKVLNFKKGNYFLIFLLTSIIIINGDKFVLRPKAFYSVNHDMRDIALIDYDQVFNLIKNKSGKEISIVAIIDTWPDRSRWYLGLDFENIYHFRWIDSGFRKNTSYYLNEDNEKIVNTSNLKLIGELSDLEMAMSKFPMGFIWIDDSSLPADVINYSNEHFYKELYLDHYPLDDNPYSIWPGTLYSWGFETPNPVTQYQHPDYD